MTTDLRKAVRAVGACARHATIGQALGEGEVVPGYALRCGGGLVPCDACLDRVIAAVAVRTLREAAADYSAGGLTYDWLRSRADAIERGGDREGPDHG